MTSCKAGINTIFDVQKEFFFLLNINEL